MERNLIQVKNNKITTTSLLVAETFNKRHDNVMRMIESLKSDSSKLRSDFFIESTYQTDRGKVYRCYELTRDGFTLLAMGFTGSEALEWKLKYIDAFNRMEKQLREGKVIDTRFELAKLIVKAPESRLQAIRELYPEYFSPTPEKGSLEYVSDVNTSYLKWKEEYNIDRDWIGCFPTIDVYNHYMRYCVENRLPSMGKKVFYKTLENDFYLTRKQKYDGHRYFIGA